MASGSLGTLTLVLTADDAGFNAAIRDADGKLKDLHKSAENSTGRMETSFGRLGGFMKGAFIGSLAAVGAAITGLIIKNFDNAIKRVDTLNNSVRTFENMGFDNKSITKMTKELDLSIRGLPTALDAAIRGVQNIAAVTGDLEYSRREFNALNNAILGFGGSADMVENAIQQLTQLPMDGPLDGQTWLSLRNSGLTPVLNAIAKDMGLSLGQLKDNLSDGTLKVKDLTDEFIKLNEKGGGGLVSLEKIARDSTAGIQTGFANMNTAIARGLADIVQKIGAKNISDTISAVGRGLEVGLKAAGDAIVIFGGWLQWMYNQFKPVFDAISQNKELMDVLKTTLIVLAAIIGGAVVLAFGLLLAAVALVIGIIKVAIAVVDWIVQRVINLGNWLGWAVFQVMQFGQSVGAWFGAARDNAVNAVNRIVGTIQGFGNSLYSSGRALIDGFVRGIRDSINGAVSAAKDVVGAVAKFFPHSPAKEGPFSGRGYTTHSGKALIQDFADSIAAQSAYLNSAVAGVMAGANGALVLGAPGFGVPSVTADQLYSGAVSGGGAATISQTNIVSTDVDMKVVNEDLMRRARRAR